MKNNFQGEMLKDSIKYYGIANGYVLNYFTSNLPNQISKMKKLYDINIYGEKGSGLYNGEYIYKLADDSREKVVALLKDNSLNPTHYNILNDLIDKDCIFAIYSNPYGCKNVLSIIRRLEKKGIKFKREWRESETTNKKYIVVFLDKDPENVLYAKELLKTLKIDNLFTLNNHKKCA